MSSTTITTSERTITNGAHKGHYKRDTLREIEASMQKCWESEKLFECDAPSTLPSTPEDKQREKFMVTFPYPYMNGRLHLGHSFSFSKAEFAAGFERMQGKRVLFPFAFHCTGMPIKAAADKLRKEMEQYGCPPQFPGAEDSTAAAAASSANGKHSKVAAKTGTAKFQWQIMEQLGVPLEEIPKFADPAHWTRYFPPLAERDLKDFGAGIDWRRSFITTDLNPFYDAFIQWQFRRLRSQGKITFGKRYCIYSPLDGQPCMDHDRASGEGVEPKEYTAIKLELVDRPACLKDLASHHRVFLVAATLRPETMYGQTNCWVGPDLEYGVFQVSDDQLFVMTDRAALNLAFQGYSREHGRVERVAVLKGTDLIGLFVKAPLAVAHDGIVPVLPMMTVVSTIGTGIVTSVPGSSADDYACLRDLREKEALRKKYNLTESQVLPFSSPVSVVKTEAFGQNGAETVVRQLNIRSQNDRDLLDKAKDMLYKEEFYNGVMMVGGEFVGRPVQEVKPLVRRLLIDAKMALPYYEPEKRVVSRSGDDCVVCLTDQWFIAYGEPAWRVETEKALSRLNCFLPEVRNQFEATLQWMQQWACSRSFGLGTKLPWDPQFLIESLSDSTIYMAFYCIAHLLHQGSLDGSVSPHGVTVEQMTDSVFDYIFSDGPLPADSTINQVILGKMRHEFRYFYPLDLRVSGKDLVPNHLTFFLYNHVALFDEQMWPRGVRANGHLLLNGQKMSKSTGNFMTMSESCQRFGADATRIALADAGDGVEDANFVEDTADKAILRLFTNLEACRDIYDHPQSYRHDDEAAATVFADRVFAAEMEHYGRLALQAYTAMNYREALHAALFGLHNCRDSYRDMTVVNGNSGMSFRLMDRFARLSCQLLAPICPHYCDYIHRHVIKAGSVFAAGLPSFPVGTSDHDSSVLKAADYVRQTAHSLRSLVKAPANTCKAQLFVAKRFPKWQQDTVEVLRQCGNESSDDEVVRLLKPVIAEHSKIPGVGKKIIPFAMELRRQVIMAASSSSDAILDRRMPFDEMTVITDCVEYLQQSLGLMSLDVIDADTCADDDHDCSVEVKRKAESAEPGRPSFRILQ